MRLGVTWSFIVLSAWLTGCASLSQDPLTVQLVGIEPLAGQDMEVRFSTRLRLQNPNDQAVTFNGVALKLHINDRPLASGVSDQAGHIPRYGETLVDIPMSLSALTAFRQVTAWMRRQPGQSVPYRIQGKLSGGLFGTVYFSDEGHLDDFDGWLKEENSSQP